MNRKTTNTILLICSVLLAISGLIFLLVSIFGEAKADNWALNSALASIILANIFNIIRIQLNKRLNTVIFCRKSR